MNQNSHNGVNFKHSVNTKRVKILTTKPNLFQQLVNTQGVEVLTMKLPFFLAYSKKSQRINNEMNTFLIVRKHKRRQV